MGQKTKSFLKNKNSDFNNILDSMLNLTDGGTVTGATTVTGRATLNGGATIKGFTKLTATGAIAVADSGRTLLVGAAVAGLAADTILTLPAAADGLYYKFLYMGNAADAQDFQINTGANANFFIGGVDHHDTTDDTENEAVSVFGDGNSNSRVNILTPAAGTVVECFCDGTNWFLHGQIVGATAPTFADQ